MLHAENLRCKNFVNISGKAFMANDKPNSHLRIVKDDGKIMLIN